MESSSPQRGEIWIASLGAGRSGEPGKNRPVIVISVDELTTGSERDLFIVVPVSSSAALSPLTPMVTTDEGVDKPSIALTRAVRSVTRGRFLRRVGVVDRDTLREIEFSLGAILGLN